jgi:hypothetical protein
MATLTYSNITGGIYPVVTESATLLSGENRTAGTLLGKITLGAATVVVGAGNTGDGVFTIDATTPILDGAVAGAYTVTCVIADTNSGTFEVRNPDGLVLGLNIVGDTFANQIKFAIADGATDFVAGDVFTVTIAAGSGKLKLCNSANLDGSQQPYAILLEDKDASLADKTVTVGLTGEYNSNFMTFGGTDTVTTHKNALRLLSIYLKTGVAA